MNYKRKGTKGIKRPYLTYQERFRLWVKSEKRKGLVEMHFTLGQGD